MIIITYYPKLIQIFDCEWLLEALKVTVLFPVNTFLNHRTYGPSINDVGNFSGFLTPRLPHVGSFLVLSVGNFDQFLTPPPLSIADVSLIDGP